MRIALLTYSTRARGGVVHTLALAEALAALGEEVTVYAVGRDEAFFRPLDGRVRVHLAPLPERPDETVGERVLRSVEVLAAAVDRRRHDVVHAQDCISANAVPDCVRTVHHLDVFSTAELAACHERAIVSPRAHICVSAAVASELLAGWGIRARVIPNGVDYHRFAAAEPCRRDRPYLLSVGGIEPRKGTVDLLEAYAPLAVHLEWVIGGGETLFDYRHYRAAFDHRASELGVAPTVLGPVAHDALPSLMAGAAVFAFPSVKEGFGLAAMEALAAGAPVVVRDLPVFREVFGATVRYATDVASLTTALRAALADPPDPGPGRALAASLTWEAAARAHLAFYREVVR